LSCADNVTFFATGAGKTLADFAVTARVSKLLQCGDCRHGPSADLNGRPAISGALKRGGCSLLDAGNIAWLPALGTETVNNAGNVTVFQGSGWTKR